MEKNSYDFLDALGQRESSGVYSVEDFLNNPVAQENAQNETC